MIDRIGLAELTPARRAEVIYSEAQAELAKRLWQAALGDGDDTPQRQPARADRADSLDSLLAALLARAQDGGASAAPAAVAPSQPSSANALTTVTEDAAAVGTVDGLGPNHRHAAALAQAAERTGIPAPALAAIVDAEAGKARDGSWETYSRNPRSSAAGLGQFLSRTWEGLAETRGTWLHGFAQAHGWLGQDGQVRAEARAALLATRYDATASINGIADYARRNLDGLQRSGVTADGDVGATARLAYLGHHLGLGDAVRFIRNHGLGEDRARVLLGAQVGSAGSAQRIAAAGDATSAHRTWLLGYLDRKVRPDRFTTTANV